MTNPVELAREALTAAEGWFREYEQLHRAKGTTDGDLKAEVNDERADYLATAVDMLAALSALPVKRGDEQKQGFSPASADLSRASPSPEQHSAGWVLVPREPTEAMLRAYYETKCKPSASPAGGFTRWATWQEVTELADYTDEMRACYRAMLVAAAPPADHDPQHGGWRDTAERLISVVLDHRPDASFDDSQSGHIERRALLENIVAEMRAALPAPPAVTALSGGQHTGSER